VFLISDIDVNQTLDLANKTRDIFPPTPVTDQVFLGIEGFVDKIWSVVRVRHSESDFEVMESMVEWADRINAAAGSSGSIERILKRSAAGGFTSNVGKALSTLCGRTGNVHLVGLFGVPTIRDILREQLIDTYNCVLYSMGNPGETDAFEFDDGKIMMAAFGDSNQLDWNQIISSVGQDFLVQELDASKVWGVGYWSAIPHMSEIFTRLQEDVFPNLSQSTGGKHLVLDLSDLQKKPRETLQDLVDILPRFEDSVRTVLLLNDRELETLSSFLGGGAGQTPLELTKLVQQDLNLSFVLAHSPEWATVCSTREEVIVANANTPSPRFTTSAGDHFTAGICFGLLAGLDADILPILGNCTTCYFVRTGISPSAQDIQQFLANYPIYLDTKTQNILE